MANKLLTAYEILKTYSGSNSQIRYFKYINDKRGIFLDDFAVEYIIENKDFEPYMLNKTFKISQELSERITEKESLEFYPQKIKITKVIGEMGGSVHCYVQYRQSVAPKLMYIPRKYVFGDLNKPNDQKIDIDFDVFDKMTESTGRKLKEHQKSAAEFLLRNRKCILADSMGLGKTTSAIIAALSGGFERILVITTASLKSTWNREISIYEKDENITVINGSKWDEVKKFTVINYDIAQNFYEVAEEPVLEDQYVYDENGNIKDVVKVPVMVKSKSTGKLVPKMQKSRQKDKIRECLEKSPLFLSKFDCVIIDEAQKLSNNKSIRYKTIDDFIRKSKPKAVFLVTGTPLTNNPMNLYHIMRLIDADVTKDYTNYVMRYCGGKKMRLKTGREIIIANKATNLEELREKIKHIYIRRLASDIEGMVQKTVLTKNYDLNQKQKKEYERLWEEYQKAQTEEGKNDNEEYRQLVEGMLVRQYLAKEMVSNTCDLVDSMIEYGEKAIIICTFQEEMDMFKEHYGKKAVMYNGKMSTKQKDKSEREFMENDDIKVFIGQIEACGVGLTLTRARYMVFNSYSWLQSSNLQAEDRIYRVTQDRDVTCIYQLFTDSVSQDMYEKVIEKGRIMNEVIKKEGDKSK